MFTKQNHVVIGIVNHSTCAVVIAASADSCKENPGNLFIFCPNGANTDVIFRNKQE